MRIRSLRGATFAVVLLSLALASCGTSSNKSQLFGCGCGFLYATTNTNEILSFKLSSSGVPGPATSSPGPANSSGITSGTLNNGEFLYVSDGSRNAMDVFTLNNMNGSFTPATGSPFSLTGPPAGIAITGYSMAKTYLYTADGNGKIDAFNALNGTLSPITGSPFAAGMSPLELTAMTPAQSFSVFVYAPDFDDPNGAVRGFSVALDGTLSAVPGSPFKTALNSGPRGIVSNGNYIYVALSNTNKIAGFRVDLSGDLSAVSASPFSAGAGPSSLAVSAGGFLYALNAGDGTISGYIADPNTGTLTSIGGSPFPAGTASGLLALYTPSGAALQPQVLYAADTNASSIVAYSINPTTGGLTPLPGSPFRAGAGPIALAAVSFPGPPSHSDPP